ncbi:pathogenicity island protein [Staphylococcus felis]|uniref:Pathogenicity island protein n=1 Tax=Staphylococcus felis TaxID=46127 RepID=A0ABS0QMK7_9STAP|nr:pathogenicity island protein [Staphylococcus felis]MBH9580354.1 pathogenicity island protein [Staphylococcus felis]REH74477.1 pathogenicity island protein [Staphylococcus felis]REH87158.1 pathogenicity island protein [Staphylococcus felis]REH97321.1 pathogenicity island protein [Staphylococcus felis]REI28489.1 pathogenicity island protein [Staphylococcus felis]
MKKQVIITKTIVGWHNIKTTDGQLLLNVAPNVLQEHFPEINSDASITCMEINFDRITEIKNKKKVGN